MAIKSQDRKLKSNTPRVATIEEISEIEEVEEATTMIEKEDTTDPTTIKTGPKEISEIDPEDASTVERKVT